MDAKFDTPALEGQITLSELTRGRQAQQIDISVSNAKFLCTITFKETEYPHYFSIGFQDSIL